MFIRLDKATTDDYTEAMEACDAFMLTTDCPVAATMAAVSHGFLSERKPERIDAGIRNIIPSAMRESGNSNEIFRLIEVINAALVVKS